MPAPRRGAGFDALRVDAMLEEHVLGLHVAVHDAGGVRMRKRTEQLDGERRRDLGRQRAATSGSLAQRRAAHELDDEVLLVLVLGGDVEHLDDVAVPELGDRLGFACEAVRDLAALAEVRMEHLDRDVTPETLVVRTVNRRPYRRARAPRALRTWRGLVPAPLRRSRPSPPG